MLVLMQSNRSLGSWIWIWYICGMPGMRVDWVLPIFLEFPIPLVSQCCIGYSAEKTSYAPSKPSQAQSTVAQYASSQVAKHLPHHRCLLIMEGHHYYCYFPPPRPDLLCSPSHSLCITIKKQFSPRKTTLLFAAQLPLSSSSAHNLLHILFISSEYSLSSP